MIVWLIFFMSLSLWAPIYHGDIFMGLFFSIVCLLSTLWTSQKVEVDRRVLIGMSVYILFIIIEYLFIDIQNNIQFFWRTSTIGFAFLVYFLAKPGMLGVKFILAILLSANLMAIESVASYFSINDAILSFDIPVWIGAGTGFGGAFFQASINMLFMLLSTLGAWTVLLRGRVVRYWVPVIAALPMASIFMSGSRAVFLMLPVVIFFVLYVALKRGDHIRRTALLVSLTLFFGFSLSSYWSVNYHIEGSSSLERLEAQGFTPRSALWCMGLKTFMDHPVTGVGIGNMTAHSISGLSWCSRKSPSLKTGATLVEGENDYAHNVIIDALAEGGVAGGLFILIVSWLTFRGILFRRHGMRVFTGVAAFLMLMHGMFSVSLEQGYIMSLFALLLAMGKRDSRVIFSFDIMRWWYILPAVFISSYLWITGPMLRTSHVFFKKANSIEYIEAMISVSSLPLFSLYATQMRMEKMINADTPDSLWVIMLPEAKEAWRSSQTPSTGLAYAYALMASNNKDESMSILRLIKPITRIDSPYNILIRKAMAL